MKQKLKLYFAPSACSLAPHIALREAVMEFNLEKVDIRAGKTASGENYGDINPLGYVPALQLPDGSILTEAVAILLYIADQKPEIGLAPEPKTATRYQLYRWLTFISSEIHKGFGPLFNPALPEEQKNMTIERLKKRFAFIDKYLEGRTWLVGDSFTIADIYMFVCLSWTNHMQIDLSPWKNIQSFLTRVGERSAVREALAAEQQP